MRELCSLGEAVITCDFSRLPVLDELDPERSYLSWTIELRAVQDENAVRAVFEFVEWDCQLDVVQGGAAQGFDDTALEALIEKMQATVEAELAAPEVPPNDVQASMDEPLATQAGSAGQALGEASRTPANLRRPRFVSISIASIA